MRLERDDVHSNCPHGPSIGSRASRPSQLHRLGLHKGLDRSDLIQATSPQIAFSPRGPRVSHTRQEYPQGLRGNGAQRTGVRSVPGDSRIYGTVKYTPPAPRGIVEYTPPAPRARSVPPAPSETIVSDPGGPLPPTLVPAARLRSGQCPATPSPYYIDFDDQMQNEQRELQLELDDLEAGGGGSGGMRSQEISLVPASVRFDFAQVQRNISPKPQ